MPPPLLTPSQLAAIRADHAAGCLNVRGWARALGCGAETVRRAARGETYVSGPPTLDSQDGSGTAAGAGANAPGADALAGTLRRLQAEVDQLPPQPKEIDTILDELTKQGGVK